MMLEGREMFSWVRNGYVKYPSTQQGIRAAELSMREGIRVNLTLRFSQQQAAAIYAATKGSRAPVYVSPFIGRLDDVGFNGIDLVRNIKRMNQAGDGHVHVLTASLRSVRHLLSSFALQAELATAPGKVFEEWGAAGFPIRDEDYISTKAKDQALQAIPHEELDLNAPWESFDLRHELTTRGIRKFVADYQEMLIQPGQESGEAQRVGKR
jgi:transaldolase